MTKSQERVAAAAAALAEAGYEDDGETARETVRIPTVRAPVHGGVGGEPATFGGRARYRKSGSSARATVGARTTAFYDAVDGKTGNMRAFDTKDIAAIRKELDIPDPTAPPSP